MAVKFNQINNYTPSAQPTDINKNNLLSQLEELNKKKQELLKSLREVEEQEAQIKTQLSQLEVPEKKIVSPEPNQTTDIVKTTVNIEQFVKPYLLVDTTKIIKSDDSKGTWEHYSLFLISKENEKMEINKPPIDVTRYGNISQIVIDEGTNKTVLKANESFSIQRLIHYFSTDSEVFRKEINAEQLDFHGQYANRNVPFECQRFSYYLQYGKEGKYSPRYKQISEYNYREVAKHTPGKFYSLTAQTCDFGKNGVYSQKDCSTHHYICLTQDVFVSKFGEHDVVFSSYKQIVDAYFPAQFNRGNFNQELF